MTTSDWRSPGSSTEQDAPAGSHTRPIVVGLDGRPSSAGALRYAVAEAVRQNAPLVLVHVIRTFGSGSSPEVAEHAREAGTAVLREALATVRRTGVDLAVTTRLAHGDRSDSLTEATLDGQLVVLGRDGRPGTHGQAAGTTTAGVVMRSASDVVVVPSFWVGTAPRGRVLVGVKPGRSQDGLLARAFAVASTRGAALTVMLAWHLGDLDLDVDRLEQIAYASDRERDGLTLLGTATAEVRAAFPEVPVDLRVVHGTAADQLLLASTASDLVMVARRRTGVPPSRRVGDVGHTLLRLSDVPVQFVPEAVETPAVDPVAPIGR